MGSFIKLIIMKLMIDFHAYTNVETYGHIILLKKGKEKQILVFYHSSFAYTPYLEIEAFVKMVWTYIALHGLVLFPKLLENK